MKKWQYSIWYLFQWRKGINQFPDYLLTSFNSLELPFKISM